MSVYKCNAIVREFFEGKDGMFQSTRRKNRSLKEVKTLLYIRIAKPTCKLAASACIELK